MSTNRPGWTTDDIPDQRGRVAIVTGANTGIGLETARALAGRGATVVLAVRNLEKGRAAVDDIRAGHPDGVVELQQLDLASLDSVRAAAGEIRDRFDRIDLLINNAGVMYAPRGQTADGFELQFGTNHLGHFAWTGLLIERLLEVDGSRVVTVGSLGHGMCRRLRLDEVSGEGRYVRFLAYGRSKLASMLFTYALQRRLADAGAPTIALAAHPGGVDTNLARRVPGTQLMLPLASHLAQQPSMGALPTLRAATDPDAVGGTYYGPDGRMQLRGHPVVVSSSKRSYDVELQREVWRVSERLTGVTFPL
jgi:NAD(P)-dependent dehydrogenase (short-subunit alcohol dehydrogenase family)